MADYSLETIASAADLPADWDSLLAAEEALHTRLFNRTVAEAGVEQAWLTFLVVRDEGCLVATATLSAFAIDLGLFLGKTAERWLHSIRRLMPGFLRIKILLCGLPASFGQANLAFAPGANRAECLRLIAAKMEVLAQEKHLNYLCFKEFPRGADLQSAFKNERTESPLHRYFRAPSLPDTRLDLRPFGDFSAYLAAMRSPYRRKVQLSLRKLGLARPEVQPFSSEHAADAAPVLLYGGAETCPPEVFHALYRSVMARAETKLETLNLAFFQRLYENYAGQLVVLALWQGGKIEGAVLLLPAGHTLLWLLVGIEQPKDVRFDTYFNLTLGLIDYAFRAGFQQIKTGQTAYPFKLRLGAQAEELDLYFRARRPGKHFLLEKLRGVIFPPTLLPNLRVFHHD